jgi:hypothetical protein
VQHQDEWGRDPRVRRMRQVFAAMEDAHREILWRTGLSAFDPRLRSWRERALAVFEGAWVREIRAGREDDVGALYARCLGEVLADDGIPLVDPPAGPSSPAGEGRR